MTPEERADDVLQHYTHVCGGAPYDPLFLGRLIVDAIAAAVDIEREQCAVVCDAIADDTHDQYKGRGTHVPNNDHRADTYTEGESSGAGLCAVAIRTRATA